MNSVVIIDEKSCTGCGQCVEICPRRILSINKATGKCQVSDENNCDRRAGCERLCPAKAIKIR